jgi:hypothetical protein
LPTCLASGTIARGMKKHLSAALSARFFLVVTSIMSGAFVQAQTIENPSFEDPLLAPGEATTGAFRWQSTGIFGTFRPGEFGQDGIAPNGSQAGYINSGSGAVWQTLGISYDANTDYRLNFFLSARSGPALTDVSVALFQGAINDPSELNSGNIVAIQLFDGTTGVVSDEFRQFSLFVPASAVAAANAAGQAIGIGFFGVTVNGLGNNSIEGNSDFDLDSVSLTVTPIPEPSTMALGLLGISMLLLTAKHHTFQRRP